MTITLTPSPASSAIAVSVTAGPSIVSLVRTDANGSASVRLPDGTLPTSNGIAIIDYEPAVLGPVTYVARSSTGAVQTATATLGSDRSSLTIPIAPLYSVGLPLVIGYGATRDSATTIHDVIGRADPIATLGPLGLRRGTLEIFADSYSDLRKIVDLYARNQVVLLRQPDHAGMDLYHIATTVNELLLPEALVPRKWAVVVTYVEVAAPRGPVQGTLGWDFDAVTASAPDFDTLTGQWQDFNALTIGPLS